MSKTEAKKGKSKKDKPIVKVPTSPVGRAVFLGSQAVGAFSAARALRTAREKGDRLALTHAILNAALLVVTLLLAKRTMSESRRATESAAAEPLMLPSGK